MFVRQCEKLLHVGQRNNGIARQKSHSFPSRFCGMMVSDRHVDKQTAGRPFVEAACLESSV
ncbi:hypothetical protein INR49_028093 [Caranx melampygus]|nr:hypothetical protein INR49_028093 [Caranx melampygus]